MEKRLCFLFKEVLEGRERGRKFLDTFAVKQNARKIRNSSLLKEYKGLNSSYKILEHNLSSGKRHPVLSSLLESVSPGIGSLRKVNKKVTEDRRGAANQPGDSAEPSDQQGVLLHPTGQRAPNGSGLGQFLSKEGIG